MFDNWKHAENAYSLSTKRYTYVKNWKQHEGIKKFIRLIDCSTLDSVNELNGPYKIIEIYSSKLDLDLIDNSIIKRFENFSHDYGLDVKDWNYDQYRYIENLKISELDLHYEFNDAVKSINKNGVEVTIFAGSGSNEHESLDVIKERIKTEDVEYVLTGKSLKTLEEWSGIKKDHWFKEDNRLWILNSRIMSVIYDEKYKLDNKVDLRLDHPALIYRNDYDVGNGKRVMNWETVNAKTNLWNVSEWDDFGIIWDKIKSVTRGKAYPGLICNFTENTDNKMQVLEDFLTDDKTV